MEGFLLVPPDRNTLLGRSAWKTRYVVLGLDLYKAPPPLSTKTSSKSSKNAHDSRLQSSLKQLKLTSRNTSLVDVSEVNESDGHSQEDTLVLSIYKQKGDAQPLARYTVTSMKSCTVDNMSYRKNNSIQPTLVVQFGENKVERNRGRLRSSQLDFKTRSDTLLFRSPQDSPQSVLDWHDVLHPHLPPLGPTSHFDSKFSFSDGSSRPSSSTPRPPIPRSQDSHVSAMSSNAASRVRSPALSIHSSHTGDSRHHEPSPRTMTFDQSHATVGKENRPMSPARPRETILDRAFMLNYVPTASMPLSTDPEDEKNMTSLARFEALMQALDASKAIERRRSSHALPEDANPHIISSSAQRALAFISAGSSSARMRGRGARSRPTSLALPMSSSRNSMIDELSERRRSSISIAPSPSTSTLRSKGPSSRHLSITDFTRRFSSTFRTSTITSTTTTATSTTNGANGDGVSNRSSWASGGSFACSGEEGGEGREEEGDDEGLEMGDRTEVLRERFDAESPGGGIIGGGTGGGAGNANANGNATGNGNGNGNVYVKRAWRISGGAFGV
ncbi:MAG: hypothetical protein M1838_005676 [Thelocarpon superellum]|nr:MAG: hypothetical protein M1838_005676 [Thelocarpon superellum]